MTYRLSRPRGMYRYRGKRGWNPVNVMDSDPINRNLRDDPDPSTPPEPEPVSPAPPLGGGAEDQPQPTKRRGGAPRLTWDDVRAIRAAYAQPPDRRPTQAELADHYGVTQEAIHSVIHRKTWARDPAEHQKENNR